VAISVMAGSSTPAAVGSPTGPSRADRSPLAALQAISLSHRSVGLERLAAHALDADGVARLHAQLSDDGVASVILATCNRTELYWHADAERSDTVADTFARHTGLAAAAGRLRGSAAAAHLFRVCAGLESVVLGEAEILGQVRAALDASPGAGPFLRGVVQAALRAGRQARAETALAVGAQSVASAAVGVLARALPLDRRHVLVVGAGATGAKVARHLRARGVGRLVVTNRTADRATALAARVAGETAAFDALPDALAPADAVVCAVDAPSPLVSLDHLRWAVAARHGRPLMAIDLSMPPAIATGEVAGVTRVDLAALERDVAAQHDRRAAEVPKALAVIERELDFLEAWARRQALRPLVADLRRKLEGIRQAELARTRAELPAPGGGDGDALDRLTRRLLDQVLAIPAGPLGAGHVTIDADKARYLRRLFALDQEPS
jgi:glutamyl-tRNA reductase